MAKIDLTKVSKEDFATEFKRRLGEGISTVIEKDLQSNPDFKKFVFKTIKEWKDAGKIDRNNMSISADMFIEFQMLYEETLRHENMGYLSKLWYRFDKWMLKTGEDDGYNNS